MSFERDLREALQPLAGDPVADALRVLAALPTTPKPAAPSRRPWLVLSTAAAFAAGLAVAWCCRPESTPSAPPQSPVEAKPQPHDKPPKDSAESLAQQIQFVALDNLEIDEPGDGVQHIRPGAYRAKAGTKFTTGRGLVGAFAFASEAQVRFASDTVATLQAKVVALAAGKLWLRGRSGPVEVHAEVARIEGTHAELLVERQPDGLFVACITGAVTVRCQTGEIVRLSAGQQCKVGPEGAGRTAVIPFVGALTGWFVPLLFAERDDGELQERVGTMLEAWFDGRQRKAAERELRRLGAHAVPGLYKRLDELEPALRAEAAALIADLADHAQVDRLLAMLAHADADVRIAAWRALTRITGFDVEPEAFWRREPNGEHELARQRWRVRVR